MDDKPVPHSGSRWEPAPTPAAEPPSETAGDAARAAAPSPRTRRLSRGRRGALVAAAAGVAALAGLGGYALGQAATGNLDRIGLVSDSGGAGQDRAPRGEGQVPGTTPPGSRVLPPGEHGELDDDGPGDYDRHGDRSGDPEDDDGSRDDSGGAST